MPPDAVEPPLLPDCVPPAFAFVPPVLAPGVAPVDPESGGAVESSHAKCPSAAARPAVNKMGRRMKRTSGEDEAMAKSTGLDQSLRDFRQA
jgi:hypothetical protein